MGHHSCCNKEKVKRGLWSPEEDEKLINYISTHGHGCWTSVPRLAGLQRCGKSCRLRWVNYLRPDLKRGSFSPQEESIIIELHRMLGNRWSQIAKHLPGRTDNEVKNLWNSSIKKKLTTHGVVVDGYNPLASNEDLLPQKKGPDLMICAPEGFVHEDLKTNVGNFLVDWIAAPPTPSHASANDFKWPCDYHHDQDHHQEDYQSHVMYGNESNGSHCSRGKYLDSNCAMHCCSSISSAMPALCKNFEVDECNVLSSAPPNIIDPNARVSCFGSRSYLYDLYVPMNQMTRVGDIMEQSSTPPQPPALPSPLLCRHFHANLL